MKQFLKNLSNTLGIGQSGGANRALTGAMEHGRSVAAENSTLDRVEHKRGAIVRDLSGAYQQTANIPGDTEHPIRVGGVPIPSSNEQQHFVFIGAPGTGKSVAIKQVLRSIRARGQKAIVFDPAGEFTASFYREGRDHIFNPLDARHMNWSIWKDTPREGWSSIAETIIPEPNGGGGGGDGANMFFMSAARIVLRALFRTCKTLDEVLIAGLSESDAELRERVEKIGMVGLLGPEKTFQSTRATLGVGIEALAVLPSCDLASSFSINHWLTDNDDDSWLLMPIRKDHQKATKIALTLFLNMVVERALSLEQDKARRIWTVVDELPSLGKLNSLEMGLAEGRKFGLTFVLGMQATGQIKGTYGKDAGSAMLSMPKTRLIARVSDSESAEDASKELGERQIVRHKTSTNQGQSSNSSMSPGAKGEENHSFSDSHNSGSSQSRDYNQERVVLPSEIAGLPDLRGYLRMGSEHVYKVAISWEGLPQPSAPGVVPVPQRTPPWEAGLDQADTDAEQVEG